MSLKDFKEKEVFEVLEHIRKALNKCGVEKGQIRIQVEDAKNSVYSKGNDITEKDPVIVSTGSGIFLFAKLDF